MVSRKASMGRSIEQFHPECKCHDGDVLNVTWINLAKQRWQDHRRMVYYVFLPCFFQGSIDRVVVCVGDDPLYHDDDEGMTVVVDVVAVGDDDDDGEDMIVYLAAMVVDMDDDDYSFDGPWHHVPFDGPWKDALFDRSSQQVAALVLTQRVSWASAVAVALVRLYGVPWCNPSRSLGEAKRRVFAFMSRVESIQNA